MKILKTFLKNYKKIRKTPRWRFFEKTPNGAVTRDKIPFPHDAT